MTMPKEERRRWVDRGFRDPVRAYRAQAVEAARRGIEFKFTFAEWWQIWGPSYEQRGPRRGQLVMCRTRDKGAYETGNVRLDTPLANALEAKRVRQFECQGNADAGWLYDQRRRSMGYFQYRELMERRAEMGLDGEDSQYGL